MNIQAEALAKAGVLSQALPWLLRFRGSTIVIKFGGNAMVDSALLNAFAEDVVFLKLAGINPIVVHGGGPQISKALKDAQIETKFIKGLRETPKEAIPIIKNVLVNTIQKQIVDAINNVFDCAQGFSGDENQLLLSQKTSQLLEPEVDLGMVGDVVLVNSSLITNAINNDKVPVISTLGIDSSAQIFNINADNAAAAIAIHLSSKKLILLTDVVGLLANYPDKESLISQIHLTQLSTLLADIDEGMRPKMQACFDAVSSGVMRAHVIDGRIPHALLVEVFTDQGAGTMVIRDE